MQTLHELLTGTQGQLKPRLKEQWLKWRVIEMKYVCNDCSDGNDFVANCRLDLPTIAGKPKYCPVFDNKERCNWEEVKAPKESLEWGETIQ